MNKTAAQKLIPERSVPLRIAFEPSVPRKKTMRMMARLTRNTSPWRARWEMRNLIGSIPKEIALPIIGKLGVALGIVGMHGGLKRK